MFAHLPLILLAQASGTPTQSPTSPDPVPAEEPERGRLGTAQQGGSGDIVVTARRRSETVQSVPIAISVLGGQALAHVGAYNVNRITQLQPSLQFFSTNPRNSAANIRGLGAPFGLTNDGIEQGVGIYVDQVYYSRIASATFDFTDTDRIEILRGPQGTLYGKNTTAGAINIYTRKPSFTFEGRVELTGGNYDFFQGKASVSGPLIDDKLAIRLSTSITTRKGTIYNTRLNQYQNSQDNQSFRGQLLWKPTDTLDLTLYGDYNHQDPKCCVQYYVRTGPTQRPLNRQYAALAAAFNYTVPSTNAFDRVTDLDAVPRARQKLGGTSLVANLDLGGATLTSVTAYRFWDWLPNSDRDFTGLPITTVSANKSQQNQVSQELRVASNGSRTLDYVAGAFYFHQNVNVQGLQVQGSAASRFLLNPGSVTAVPPGSSGCATATTNACNPAVLNGLTQTLISTLSNTSAAAFGKLTWHLSTALSVSPGLRVNYDLKDASYVGVVTNGAGVAINCTPPIAGALSDQCATLTPQSYTAHLSKWNVSGDLTLAYLVAPDIHAYATYARSSKSAGVNLSGLPLDATNQPIFGAATVKPETVNHFEIGLKTQFLDRRATVNFAAFWTDIFDYQATVNNAAFSVGLVRGYLASVPHVRTRGVEIDSAFRPTANLSVYANGAYTDAKYVRFPQAPCPPELSGGTALPINAAGQIVGTSSAAGTAGGFSAPFCNISGQGLPGVSKWAFSWGAEYDLPARIAGADGNFYLGYDASYRSRFNSNPSPSASTYIDGYAINNFRLGFKARDNFNVFGWVRNAFDQNYYEVLATQSGSTGLVIGQPGDPRTYGVTLSKSF